MDYKPNRNSLDDVKLRLNLLNTDIIITSDEYINNVVNLECLCSVCNEPFLRNWSNLQNNPTCPNCKKTSLSDIQKRITDINKNIIVTHILSRGKHIKLQCTCGICNNIWTPHLDNLIKLKGCPSCYISNKNSGKNHYKYNPILTDDERNFGRNYNGENTIHKWRKAVFENDEYKCVICGFMGKLNAHHLNGWSWCKEERFDIDNGVTLCYDCHKDFHYDFGNKDNTKEQFQEFLTYAYTRYDKIVN